MATVDTDDLPHLHRFVTGLRRDYHAVRNGLTLSHSSGTVEGCAVPKLSYGVVTCGAGDAM
jgi:transposase